MYVRYKCVSALAGDEDAWLRRMNNASMVLGVLSSFGCSVVANFQVSTIFCNCYINMQGNILNQMFKAYIDF